MDLGLFAAFSRFRITSRKHHNSEEDLLIRINYFYLPLFLTAFSVILCTKQYIVGQPLECWTPTQFSKAWQQYAENYCWMENTYFVAANESFPDVEGNERENREIIYYQWIPFILGLQALLFYLPITYWRHFSWRSGAALRQVISSANEASGAREASHRVRQLRFLARHLNSQFSLLEIRISDKLPERIQHLRSSFYQNYNLMIHYGVTKLLFVLSVVAQFLIMGSLIGWDIRDWFQDVLGRRLWEESGVFPYITFCDFAVLDLSVRRAFTLQCVLVINMLSSRIYLLVRLVCALMFLVNLASLIDHFVFLLVTNRIKEDAFYYIQRSFIVSKKFNKLELLSGDDLELKQTYSSNWQSFFYDTDLNYFVSTMKADFWLALNIIRGNCGQIVFRDLIAAMFYEKFQPLVLQRRQDAEALNLKGKFNEIPPPKYTQDY